MNLFYIYQQVNFGSEDRWVSFQKAITTRHHLAIGMDFLIQGIWSAKITAMEYDPGDDAIGVSLAASNMAMYDRSEMKKLWAMFRREGWVFTEGMWGDEFLTEDDEAESK